MGLGIGANTAIFSVVHAVLLQSLPYPDSERLFMLSETNPAFPEMSMAYPNYLDWRAAQHSFEDLSAYRLDDFNLTGRGEPERIRGAFVTASYFRVLGLAPRLGRTFAESASFANFCSNPSLRTFVGPLAAVRSPRMRQSFPF
jgi:putative ABC transport system permease protein